jgi:hypothetical protein
MQPSMLGIPAGAEDDEVPCALTATAVMAKTTNSLENMIGWVFFWGGVDDLYVVRERKRGASGTLFMWFLYSLRNSVV